MKIVDLIAIARARLAYLTQQRETAMRLGDAEQIARIDADVAETQATLNTLLTLPSD
jgi:outer membrane protein TolC